MTFVRKKNDVPQMAIISSIHGTVNQSRMKLVHDREFGNSSATSDGCYTVLTKEPIWRQSSPAWNRACDERRLSDEVLMLRDLIGAAQQALSERIRDPLLGSFAGFFLLWNWKPIALLLFGSGGGFEERLDHVITVYRFPKADLCGPFFPYAQCQWAWSEFIRSLSWTYGVPLLLAIGYIVGYPFVKKWFVAYVQKRETEIINRKHQEEDKRWISPERGQFLQEEIRRLRRRLEEVGIEIQDQQRTECFIRMGAASKYRGDKDEYAVAISSAIDSDTINPGMWMIYIPESRMIRFARGPNDVGEGNVPCVVLERLEADRFLIKVSGQLDVNQVQPPYGIRYEPDHWLRFAKEPIGQVERKPNPPIGGSFSKTRIGEVTSKGHLDVNPDNIGIASIIVGSDP